MIVERKLPIYHISKIFFLHDLVCTIFYQVKKELRLYTFIIFYKNPQIFTYTLSVNVDRLEFVFIYMRRHVTFLKIEINKKKYIKTLNTKHFYVPFNNVIMYEYLYIHLFVNSVRIRFSNLDSNCF